MSYYKELCVVCLGAGGVKRWIRPGGGKLAVHDSAGAYCHAAEPMAFRDERVQLTMLATAMSMIAERVPGAAMVDLVTSDQDSYGFNLTGVRNADGVELLPDWQDTEHPLASLADDVWDMLADLNWCGVVGENRGGYGTIVLADFFTGLIGPPVRPAKKSPLAATLPRVARAANIVARTQK